jgi:hypothetical protein
MMENSPGEETFSYNLSSNKDINIERDWMNAPLSSLQDLETMANWIKIRHKIKRQDGELTWVEDFFLQLPLQPRYQHWERSDECAPLVSSGPWNDRKLN